jgi:hypothetical protein
MAEQQKLANVADNRELYKKAFLIEFVGNDGSVEDIFTFSVPPENEELNYSQRKTETKTFGGLHVDEYGSDAVKILLSGSTVNQELKRIYKAGTEEDAWMSGEDEVYHLRDLIGKYKTLESLQNNKRVYLYDLSKYTSQSGIKNYWQVFQGDLKIRRGSDRPFTYKYSIEFTGVTPDKNTSFKLSKEEKASSPELTEQKADKLIEIMAGNPKKWKDEAKKKDEEEKGKGIKEKTAEPKLTDRIFGGLIGALDFIDGRINAKVNNVLSEVKKVSDLIKMLGNVMNYSTSTLTGILDSVGDTAAGIIDAATNVVEGANSIVSLPRTIQLKAINIGLEVQNATLRLVKATDDLAKTCRDSFTGEYWQIPEEVLNQFGMNNEEFKDSVLTKITEAENISNELAAAAKSADIPDVTIGNPDPATGEQRIVLSYGHTDIMLKSTDTFESLAAQYLGGPDKAIDIATFNGVASLNDLEPGDIIRIPVPKKPAGRNNKNLIYSKREDRDNYGKDILLTEEGSIVVSASGDYELTSGVKNLSQSILLRLKERVAKRIRLTAYGIRINIRDPAAGVAYIVSSVDLTVMSDPRVQAIKDIRFRARGDALYVTVIYNDINRAEGKAIGRV